MMLIEMRVSLGMGSCVTVLLESVRMGEERGRTVASRVLFEKGR